MTITTIVASSEEGYFTCTNREDYLRRTNREEPNRRCLAKQPSHGYRYSKKFTVVNQKKEKRIIGEN